jgi:hypothetical protein
MGCPGITVHCPGCSEGQSLGILAAGAIGLVVAAELSMWVAARIWWIGGTAAACFALSVAASMWLEARADQRGRAWGAARGIYSRADCIAPPRAVVIESAAERPAIAPVYVLNFYGEAGEEAAARVIRTALPGTTGDAAITEGEPS